MQRHITTSPIQVAHHNAYRANHAQTVALDQCNTDIIFFTEPWWGAIGDNNVGSIAHRDYT